MELRTTIKTIREKKGWNQRQLAAALGIRDQQRISTLENAGTKLEKQWAIFVKLLPLCLELDLLEARDLLPRSLHDSKRDSRTRETRKNKGDLRRKESDTEQ